MRNLCGNRLVTGFALVIASGAVSCGGNDGGGTRDGGMRDAALVDSGTSSRVDSGSPAAALGPPDAGMLGMAPRDSAVPEAGAEAGAPAALLDGGRAADAGSPDLAAGDSLATACNNICVNRMAACADTAEFAEETSDEFEACMFECVTFVPPTCESAVAFAECSEANPFECVDGEPLQDPEKTGACFAMFALPCAP